MTIQIGAPLAHDFNNPLGVLSDCHRRVEHFLRLLIVVTDQAHGGALTAEQREALEAALRYFTEAAPNHTADEEDSLFPRLRASQHREAAAAIVIADALAHDHEEAGVHHAAVDALIRQWLHDGQLPSRPAHDLAAHLAQLAALYQRHIAIEDGELFPLARRVLLPSTLAALGREMALRRGIDPVRTRHPSM
jgi:hemerythrin-like domain-containing protein